jgi:hypothetical protein
MSIDLNERINMSTYLNKESCKRVLGQTLASAVKKLNELVEIENHQKNGKRKCYEKNKQQKLIEELHALNNIIESINVYLDLIDY